MEDRKINTNAEKKNQNLFDNIFKWLVIMIVNFFPLFPL